MDLDKDFFAEEERCGFTVSADMKKVWAVELDLLDKFQQVCAANGLRYFAAGGTLIGAVRHRGFIPWDDDIDLVMLREDYDRLLAIAPAAFEPPYFLQTAYSDKQYSRGHAQLRHSNTTAILNSEKGCFPFNQGIFIDIFPLDAVPDDPKSFAAQRRAIRLYTRLLDAGVRYPANPRKNAIKTAAHILASLVPYRFIFGRLEKACRRYNGQETRLVGPLNYIAHEDTLLYPTAGYAQSLTVPFEQGTIDIPAGYDEILRGQYGDYTVMKQENTYHGGVLFDTQRSYLDYLK